MQGKGEDANEVVKMGKIWGVWKGRWKVGCLGEKELHVCTEYIEMYNSTVYST